jgi:hypothetical protein
MCTQGCGLAKPTGLHYHCLKNMFPITFNRAIKVLRLIIISVSKMWNAWQMPQGWTYYEFQNDKLKTRHQRNVGLAITSIWYILIDEKKF